MLGVCLNCLLDSLASSNAVNKPRSVTSSAPIFRVIGIVIMGVLGSITLLVIRSPAKILPQASRLMALIRLESFSLMGECAEYRGWPMQT